MNRDAPAEPAGAPPEERGTEETASVLLVDDQPSNLDALESILESPDYRIVRALSGNEALLRLLHGDFAAIVLDMKMPDLSGIELARLIKARRRTRHIPILFLTAHMLEEKDVLQGYGVGAVDYLSKPVNPAILKSKVAVFIDLFRKTRALATANQALETEVEERQRAQEALRRANEELETRVQERTVELTRLNDCLREADRRKNQFLATLAHELRNPLAPIRNALEVMRLREGDLAVTGQARAMMGRQVSQMVRLIDDLLDVSRITSGRIQLQREAAELSVILEQAIETSRPMIEEASHELTVQLPASKVFLEADVTRLAQVFSNLLNNAAKYSDRGGRIGLTARLEGSEVVVSIRDAGIGIAREMLPRVFDLFVQVDRGLDRTQGGLGIGLTLVRQLVELHGGSVEAHSEGHGSGSELVVRLPTIPPPGPAETGATEECKAAPGNGRCRIVIADDNLDAAFSMGRLLELEGNEVHMAHDGQEALDLAESQRPDVAILDIGMPKLDGYEVARSIRAREWSKGVVLVALTGWGQAEDRRRAAEAGFDHHLVKPVDPELVRKILNARQVRAQDADGGRA